MEHLPIPRLHRLSRHDFFESHVQRGLPVVVTGLVDHWPMMKTWSRELFRERYGDDRVLIHRFERSSSWAEAHTVEDTLGSFFASVDTPEGRDGARAPYLEWSDCFHKHPELLADMGRLPLLDNWMERLPKQLADRLYMWRNVTISVTDTAYPLHYDQLGFHAFVVQLEGSKRVVWYPFEAGESLYYGAVDPLQPDLARFPKFAQAQGRMEAVIERGDVIFFPPYSWHHIVTLQDSLSVVINAVDRRNIGVVASAYAQWLAGTALSTLGRSFQAGSAALLRRPLGQYPTQVSKD